MDWTTYIKAELLILVPVLYFVGMGIKATSIRNEWIPFILGGCGILLSGLWIFSSSFMGSPQDVMLAIFTSIVQGVLCAAGAVYANQMGKQILYMNDKGE